jgi:hypothetical protein
VQLEHELFSLVKLKVHWQAVHAAVFKRRVRVGDYQVAVLPRSQCACVGGDGEALQLLDDADDLVQLLRRLVLVTPLNS